jgi:hypothetical protein
MDESPPVNRNVFAVLFSISILLPVFLFTVLVISRVNTPGEMPFSLEGDGALLLPALVLSGITGLAALQYGVIILAGAIPFGWLSWKKGIESALVAHPVSGVVLVLLQYAVIILAGAIPFGWLYWKKGIESALVAHVTSSLVLVLFTLW